jgi:dihydroflavonol-4-reductase
MLGPWDWKPSSGEMLLSVARGVSWAAPRGYFSIADVRDVCSAILTAFERGQRGRRYILAGETLSYLEAWRLFAEVTGGRWPLFRIGPLCSLLGGWIGDGLGLITGEEPNVNSGAIKIANKPRNYSSARAETELGYRKRPVRETVEDTWRWFQEYGYDKRAK